MGGVSEPISFAGISSRTKSIIPPALVLRSGQNGVLKPLILNCPNGKLSLIFASEIIKMPTLPFTNSTKNSNLFLSELIFK